MKLLFVCTGNTCRSPMAAAMGKEHLKNADSVMEGKVRVDSAGISALEGAAATSHARTVMEEKGLDIEAHQARRVSAELLAEADLVLTMTFKHKRVLLERFAEEVPRLRGRVFTLKEYVRRPAGGKEEARDAARYLESLYKKRAQLAEQLLEVEREIELYEEKAKELEVADPMGGTEEDYRQTAKEIEAAVRKLKKSLVEEDLIRELKDERMEDDEDSPSG